jgi:hypothetical protein
MVAPKVEGVWIVRSLWRLALKAEAMHRVIEAVPRAVPLLKAFITCGMVV